LISIGNTNALQQKSIEIPIGKWLTITSRPSLTRQTWFIIWLLVISPETMRLGRYERDRRKSLRDRVISKIEVVGLISQPIPQEILMIQRRLATATIASINSH
jgi:hypothetical protein